MSQLTDNIDAQLAIWWPQIKAVQAQFFAQNGRYWQGRRTHTVTPSDGVATAPDRADEIADTLSWNQMAALPPTMLSAHEFDVMHSPTVDSFALTSDVIENGNLLRRVQGLNSNGEETDTLWINLGPEQS